MKREITIKLDNLSDASKKFIENFAHEMSPWCDVTEADAVALAVIVLFAAEQARLNLYGTSYLTALPLRRTADRKLILGEPLEQFLLGHFAEEEKSKRGNIN